MKFRYAVTLWLMAIATLGSYAVPEDEQPSHGLVGLRPLPRTAKMDHSHNHGGSWAGTPTFEEQKGNYPFVAENLDVVMGWLDGDFKTKRVFFEHYWGLSEARDDLDPKKNLLIQTIRKWEGKGAKVDHVLICREYDLAIQRGHKDAKPGPFKEDNRILYEKDYDDIRIMFKRAHKQNLIKHRNYKLIQMVQEPSFFARDKRFLPIIKKCDGIAYECHQFNRHWPLETGWGKPKKVIEGAKWTLDQGKEYVFYYGPIRWKGEVYYEFMERDWLQKFWKDGLPKHHPKMHYYLNTFPHADGRGRPVGPETDPHSVLGFTKWLIEEITMSPKERKDLSPEVLPKPPAKPGSPNVLLIFSDDMGYSDLPKFGKSEIPTPNIDRLAQEGTLFTDAYVTAPICVASRMGLLTGQYQQRFGIYCNMYGEDRTRLFLKQTLLPAVFQDAGYRTAHVGKWHLSGNKRTQYETAGPRDRGFDESVAIRGGDSAFWKGTPVFRNGKQFPAPEYLTDLWGTEACAFIDRAHAQPFFLYLAYNAVHSPMHALDADQEKFSDVIEENRRIYDGMLLAMDRSIGRVLDRLDKHGVADNTIVVFMNDNGGGGSTRRYAGHSRNYANNKPLRGHKFDILEGGVRVPLIIRWPGHAPVGKVYREMVSSTDVFPTLVAGAGLQIPKGQPTDGLDLLPFISGKNSSKPHEWLCWQNRSWFPRQKGGYGVPAPKVHNSAIRKGNWKLVRLNEKIDSDAPPPAWQLYDLKNDIGEQKDLAKQHDDVVKELGAHFNKWRSSMHPTVE